MDLTLAMILTAGGAVAAAGFIKGLISMMKTLPAIGDMMQAAKAEPLAAFILSGVLVILADINAVLEDPTLNNVPFHFAAFVAWYGIARLSMAIHDDLAGNANSLTGTRVGSVDIPETNNEPPAKEFIMVEDDGPTGPVA
jgi:hypothetical protein